MNLFRIAIAAALAAASAFGQTLVGLEGPTALVDEFSGPAAGPCGYPGGPLLSSWAAGGAACPGIGPAGAFLGDVAVDKATNRIFVTDGLVVAVHRALGAFEGSFPAPAGLGPLTGLGFDSAGNVLWATDGAIVVGLGPFPTPVPCGFIPAVAVAPFPVPFAGALATDVDWDTATGTLFVCDTAGVVTNLTAAGAAGPFGPFPAPAACVPGALVGIAVDSTFAAGTKLFVSNGVTIAGVLPGGAAAPPTFAFPVPCFPVPAAVDGIALAAHGVRYGASSGPGGAPKIGSLGQSTVPGPSFRIEVTGAPAGDLAFLSLSFGALCPALPALGATLLIAPGGPSPVAGAVVPASGHMLVPTPIPGFAPIGVEAFAQWAMLDLFTLTLTSTDGLALRTSRL
jgi:hypothetical protein